MGGATVRLVVTSCRRLVRDAVCAYLSGRPEFTVVGQTGGVDTLADLCVLRRPELALVDMVELTGQTVETLHSVRVAAPATGLVVCYAEAAPQAIEAAFGAGISALVPASRGLDVVLSTLRQHTVSNGRPRPNGLALTERDMRVMSLLRSGHSVPEMARLLQLSPHTVENSKRRLYMKLGVGSSGQAVARAISLGLVEQRVADRSLRPEDRGRPPLVVLRGVPGPALDRVQLALVAAGMPYVHVRAAAPVEQDHWSRWHRGPMLAVLVDPQHDDWTVPTSLGARTVVVLSAEPALDTLVDTLLRGARALVRAADVAADLVPVLSVVARGYLALDAYHREGIAGWVGTHPIGAPFDAPALTAREFDILGSIGSGNTTRQTARALGIAAKTVENTLARLYRKLGARNRAEALSVAHQMGLLDPVPAMSRRPGMP